jgi:hypothetical protein
MELEDVERVIRKQIIEVELLRLNARLESTRIVGKYQPKAFGQLTPHAFEIKVLMFQIEALEEERDRIE